MTLVATTLLVCPLVVVGCGGSTRLGGGLDGSPGDVHLPDVLLEEARAVLREAHEALNVPADAPRAGGHATPLLGGSATTRSLDGHPAGAKHLCMSGAKNDHRQLQETAARRALPLWKDSPVRQSIRHQIATQLAEGRSPSTVLAANWTIAEAMATRFLGASRPACASGCAHCCHVRVGANAVEARALADHLRRLPPERLAPIRQRIAANAARATGCSATTSPFKVPLRRSCAPQKLRR